MQETHLTDKDRYYQYPQQNPQQDRIHNRRISNGREALREMFKVLVDHGNANQNHSEISPYTNQNS